MAVCTTELGSVMNTDQDFTFSSLFANEATNVMFVVINFNSRCTAARAVSLDFTFSLPHKVVGGFIGRRISVQLVTWWNGSEQLWNARRISMEVNVILPLCDYMLDVLYMAIYVMKMRQDKAGWRTSKRHNYVPGYSSLNLDCLFKRMLHPYHDLFICRLLHTL